MAMHFPFWQPDVAFPSIRSQHHALYIASNRPQTLHVGFRTRRSPPRSAGCVPPKLVPCMAPIRTVIMMGIPRDQGTPAHIHKSHPPTRTLSTTRTHLFNPVQYTRPTAYLYIMFKSLAVTVLVLVASCSAVLATTPGVAYDQVRI